MKVIVFGAGAWGQNYIRELGYHCVLVVEPDKATAEAVHGRFDVPIEPKLPDGFHFDGAVIATPPRLHYSLAKPPLQQGKFVLIEKPFTQTVAEAVELAQFPRCMAAHQYLWHPVVRWMRKEISLPDVHHVFTRRTNAGPVREWGNVVWDLAPHDISICYYLNGMRRPHTVRCMNAGRDCAVVLMAFDSWYSTSYVSWLGAPKVRTVEIVYHDNYKPRMVFDDVATVLETPPLTLMLKDFLTGAWPPEGRAEVGLDIVKVLTDANSIH